MASSCMRAGGNFFNYFLQATRFKVAGNLHFNRHFSEVDAYTTCNNEFTERHPVAAELNDAWSTAAAFWSSGAYIVALNNMSAICPENVVE